MTNRPDPTGYTVEKKPVTRTGKNGRITHPVRHVVTCPDGTEIEFDRRREVDRWFDEHDPPLPRYTPREIAMMDQWANNQTDD